eukprot:CAMPEP_0117597652 /NCGR_PEP_ID=MMETSP0784-20121206/74976_1 /TAXON_ID=39447 /ORGANISM="" /LENGTH=56 /DNA_ID=CAMNT_0005400047 /DNA_START=111 /DNA_END=278 /DNA_ORIENTATION=+
MRTPKRRGAKSRCLKPNGATSRCLSKGVSGARARPPGSMARADMNFDCLNACLRCD